MTAPIPYFDGHNDALLRLYKDESGAAVTDFINGSQKGHIDLPRAREGGFVGGLFALFSPPKGKPPNFSAAGGPLNIPLPPMLPAEEAATSVLGEVATLLRVIEAADGAVTLCTDTAAIRAAIARQSLAVVLHIEGAEAIGPDLHMLDVLHAVGLRSVGPLWSRPNIFGHGVPMSFPGSPDIGDGLTDAGKRLVRECNRRKIMLDVSHLNEKGFWDIVALSEAPVIATHSNVHAIAASPRNLTAKQLDAIRDSDGLVGVTFATSYLRTDGAMSPDTAMDLLVRHIDGLIERLGEDRVGIGSDFDGAAIPAAIGSVAGSQKLFEALRTHGYDDALLRKIGAENWLAVLERTWGR